MTDHDSVQYQVGAHDVDMGSVDFGGEQDNDFIEFDFEAQAIFKRLADDIYESPSAGVREPLTNAITAIFRASNQGYMDIDRGTVEITLEEDTDGGHTLTIKDNGIGITQEEIQEVLAVIGRSTVRDNDDLAGQFGMGFLAMYKLAGTDGGFIMHTRSRLNDEYTSGLWKSGGFAPSPDGFSYGELEDGEYGTKFIIPLRETIDGGDVRSWVSKYAEYARLPVIYREFDEDGSEDFNEDYGDTKIEDTLEYDHEYEYVSFENEYFRAVSCTNGFERNTLLLDVPINRGVRNIHSAPWSRNVNVRLKTENSIVVEGPHEGLRPVSESEYSDMSEERQETYIAETRLTEDDIVLPGPIGTRDKLASNEEFWTYVGERLNEVYVERVRGVLQKIDSVDDIPNLSLPEADFLFNKDVLPEVDGYEPQEMQDSLEKEYGYKPSMEVARGLVLMNERVSVAPRGDDDVTRKRNHKTYPIVRVMVNSEWGNFDEADGRDGEVYMGVSMNEWKAEAVHAANEDNVVVSVESSDKYDIYDMVLGWNKLKSVRKTNATDKLDITEDELGEILQSNREDKTAKKGTSPENSRVKLHYGEDSRNINLGKLKTSLETLGSEDIDPEDVWGSYHSDPKYGVVAVPRAGDKNLSDMDWIASVYYATVSLSSDEWEYLQGTPRVWHADEIVDSVKNETIETSEGELTVEEAKNKGTLFTHIVSDQMKEYYQNNMETVVQMLQERPWTRTVGYSETPDDLIYAPLTEDEAIRLSPALKDTDYDYSGAVYRTPGTRVSMPSNTVLYLLSKVPDWWDSAELAYIEQKVARSRDTSVDNPDFRRLVAMLEKFHDSDIDLSEVEVDEF